MRVAFPTCDDSLASQEAMAHFWTRAMHATRTDEFIITFKKCFQLRPFGLVILSGACRILKSRGVPYRVDVSTMASDIYKRFYASGCGGYLFSGRPYDETTLFRHDLVERKDLIIRFLRDQWLASGDISMSDELRAEFLSCVWEIYANAFEHGDSDFGVFTCGEQVSRDVLLLTVADFGPGIPANAANKLGKATVPGEEAMAWAFTRGTTTAIRERYARGLGLDLLKEFAKINDGSLEIHSHQGHGRVTKSDEQFRSSFLHVSGTVVQIKINCDNAHYMLQREIIEQPPEGTPLF